jgi:hypothetical protein
MLARTLAPVLLLLANAGAAPPGGSVEEATSLYEFDYGFPREAARIAGLRTILEREREALRRQLIADARGGRAEAKSGGYDYNPHALGKTWLKVTETPRFLSLSATLYTFAGGAHPNHGFDSLLWDKARGVRLAPLDLFQSRAAFDRAVRPAFCAALDRQRREKRAEPVRRGSGNPFDECIAPGEQTVILGSSHGRAFNRIGVLVAPYSAGPYAEGNYEVTLPVDAALLRAVRPEFRAAFAPAS